MRVRHRVQGGPSLVGRLGSSHSSPPPAPPLPERATAGWLVDGGVTGFLLVGVPATPGTTGQTSGYTCYLGLDRANRTAVIVRSDVA